MKPALEFAFTHRLRTRPNRLEYTFSSLRAKNPLIEFMEGEHSLTRELTTLPTPGHTPGHMSILITSQGERALILGDVAHNPAQVEETDWVSRADMDPELTRQTRRALMERLEREQTVVASGHFPAPGFGRIVRLEGRRYWQGL